MPAEDDLPIIFLGIADHVPEGQGPFPVRPIDIFQLSQYKHHLIFPISMDGYFWVILVNKSVFDPTKNEDFELLMRSEMDEKIFWKVEFSLKQAIYQPASPAPTSSTEETSGDKNIDCKAKTPAASFSIFKTTELRWVLLYAPFPSGTVMALPGKYPIEGRIGNRTATIGEVHFLYQKTPAFTLEEMKAIEADPSSVKAVRIIFGCKKCPSKIQIYSALERNPKVEKEGFAWHRDIEDSFSCECGTTTFPLTYVKENLHALLGSDSPAALGQVSYLQRYAHSAIAKIINKFHEMLKQRKDEAEFQKFIAEHSVLLARLQKSFLKNQIFSANFSRILQSLILITS